MRWLNWENRRVGKTNTWRISSTFISAKPIGIDSIPEEEKINLIYKPMKDPATHMNHQKILETGFEEKFDEEWKDEICFHVLESIFKYAFIDKLQESWDMPTTT